MRASKFAACSAAVLVWLLAWRPGLLAAGELERMSEINRADELDGAGALVGAGELSGADELDGAGALVGAGELSGADELDGAGALDGAAALVGAGEFSGADELDRAGALVGVGESDGVNELTGADESDGADESASGRGLAIIWPDVPPDVISRAQMERAASPGPEASVHPIRLYSSDVRFVNPLRRRLTPARVEAEVSGACAPSAPRFSAQLSRAVKALDFLQYDRAEQMLSEARAAVACDPEPFSRHMIGRYYFLSGIIRLHEQGDDGGLFARTLWVAPGFPFPAEFPADVREAFSSASSELPPREGVTVELRVEDLAGMELRIDGVVRTDRRVTLSAGAHFLQVVGPDGRAVAATVTSLEQASSESLTVWPPDEFRPPEASEVQLLLLRGIEQGGLEPSVTSAIAAEMKAGNHPWIMLVSYGASSRSARSLWIYPNGTTEAHTLGPTVASRPRGGRAKVLAGVLGAATLVAGGTYGYVYYQANIRNPPDGETWDQYYRAGKISGGTAIAGLAGTIITAGFGYFLSDDRSGPTGRLRLASSPLLAVGPRFVGLEMKGAW